MLDSDSIVLEKCDFVHEKSLKEMETLAQNWQQMLYRISPSYLNTFHCGRKA